MLRGSFLKEYFIVWNEWGPQDFGKPHLEAAHNLSSSVGTEEKLECRCSAGSRARGTIRRTRRQRW